jgi:uncharacterized protein YjdB
MFVNTRKVVATATRTRIISWALSVLLVLGILAVMPPVEAYADQYKLEFDTTLVDFGTELMGHEDVTPHEFTIRNMGDDTVTGIQAAIVGGSNPAPFEVTTGLSATSLTNAGQANISVRPRTNLAVGTHTARLEITSAEAPTIRATLRFRVVPDKVTSITIDGAYSGEKFSYKASGKGNTVKLHAKVRPVDAANTAVSWDSSNESIATIDKDGKVSFKGPEGSTKITARAKDGSGVTASITIKSVKNVTSIRTPLSKIYIQRGKSLTIPAVPDDRTDLKEQLDTKLQWKSSRPSVLSVTKSGKIKASKKVRKRTVVKVTAISSNGWARKTVTVVIVTKARKLKKVTAKIPESMKVGSTQKIKVKLKKSSATGVKVSFSSSNSRVIRVDKAGKMFAQRRGYARITVKAGSKTYVKSVTVRSR